MTETPPPADYLHGKSVMVTGAGGSIGSEICHQLITAGVSRLTLVSLTEGALYNVERALRPRLAQGTEPQELIGVLGNVMDRRLMSQHLVDVDVVIHAAAHKHVPICQQNPVMAIENNVAGTYMLATEAARAHVERFVMVSTDKAVKPTSVMGQTKYLAERILRGLTKRGSPTAFIITRFGNVIDSAGSVLPLWREQIAAGLPVTVTDPECERYFMRIPDAVDLVLGCLRLQVPSGVYVFDMGARRKIRSLLQELKDEGAEFETVITGLRPGEKLVEELYAGGELLRTRHPKIYRVSDKPVEPENVAVLELWNALKERNAMAATELLWSLTR